MGSVAVAYRLSCSMVRGILVPCPEIELVSPTPTGGPATTGSSGKSLFGVLLNKFLLYPSSQDFLLCFLQEVLRF